MEVDIHIHPEQRVAYIPKAVYRVLGSKCKATPNRTAVLFYNEKTPIKQVVRSVEIILEDLKHALEIQEEEAI